TAVGGAAPRPADDPFSAPPPASAVTALALPPAAAAAATTAGGWPEGGPLRGLKVIIIHVKDDMVDGPPAEQTILAELLAHEARLASAGRPLGCEFIVSRSGESYWV